MTILSTARTVAALAEACTKFVEGFAQYRISVANRYVGNSSDLDEAVVPKINADRIVWPSDGMHVHNDLTPDEIAEYIGIPSGDRRDSKEEPGKHRVVIANVLHGGHFVLVQGLGGKNRSSAEASVFVHDSGFARGIYSFSEVVGWRIFDMQMMMNQTKKALMKDDSE